MPHQRRVIRDAVKTVLVNAGTSAADRVYTTRLVPLRAAKLPALAIYTLEEDVDPQSAETAPRELKRHPRLVVEAIERIDADNIDDELDDLALAIEKAMATDETFGGTASDCWLMKTEFDFGNQGDLEIGVVRLIFHVTYFRHAPDAGDQVFDDLKTIDATYDVAAGTQAPGNRAEDKVENLDL